MPTSEPSQVDTKTTINNITPSNTEESGYEQITETSTNSVTELQQNDSKIQNEHEINVEASENTSPMITASSTHSSVGVLVSSGRSPISVDSAYSDKNTHSSDSHHSSFTGPNKTPSFPSYSNYSENNSEQSDYRINNNSTIYTTDSSIYHSNPSDMDGLYSHSNSLYSFGSNGPQQQQLTQQQLLQQQQLYMQQGEQIPFTDSTMNIPILYNPGMYTMSDPSITTVPMSQYKNMRYIDTDPYSGHPYTNSNIDHSYPNIQNRSTNNKNNKHAYTMNMRNSNNTSKSTNARDSRKNNTNSNMAQLPLSSDPSSLPHAAKSALYKTRRCRNYDATHYCRYGDLCQFAHGDNELRSEYKPEHVFNTTTTTTSTTTTNTNTSTNAHTSTNKGNNNGNHKSSISNPSKSNTVNMNTNTRVNNENKVKSLYPNRKQYSIGNPTTLENSITNIPLSSTSMDKPYMLNTNELMFPRLTSDMPIQDSSVPFPSLSDDIQGYRPYPFQNHSSTGRSLTISDVESLYQQRNVNYRNRTSYYPDPSYMKSGRSQSTTDINNARDLDFKSSL